MPLLVSRILGGLLTFCGPMVWRVLAALGMSYVSYKGFDIVIGFILDQIKSGMGSMPVEILNLLAWLWVDKAIGMMFAAYTTAMVVKMAGSSIIKKMVVK